VAFVACRPNSHFQSALDGFQAEISVVLVAVAGDCRFATAPGATFRFRIIRPLGSARPFATVRGAGPRAAWVPAPGEGGSLDTAGSAGPSRGPSLRKLAAHGRGAWVPDPCDE